MTARLMRFLRGNTIALVALFLALGGTAFAASLPKNSVGSKQLKKSAVTNAKIRNSAVTSTKVKDNSLTGNDIAEATLAKVPAATNADTVGGLAPTALVRAATGHDGSDQFFAATGDKTWTSASITAPTAGYLLVNISGYSWTLGAAGIVQHHVTLDSEVLNNPVTLLSSSDIAPATPRQAISGTRLIAVTAGPHTVNFVGHVQSGATPANLSVSRASITALFVPFNGTGTTTPLRASRPAAPGVRDSAR